MRILVTLLVLFLLGIQADQGPEWTYSEGALEEGSWATEYPTCDGWRQSPIDLQRKKAQFNPQLKALNLTGYDTAFESLSMTNNGHTVQISLSPSMSMTTSDGTEYIAKQMHFHWGGASAEVGGSEHTVDGIRRVIEVHVVHYNSKYDSYDRAQTEPDGLAVIAAFIEINEYAENTYYSQFISRLSEIKHPGDVTSMENLNVRNMLPEDTSQYYTYLGSLTTPPCSENVLWFVLANPVFLSRVQVWKIENSLLNHQNHTVQNTYRRTQKLNDRVVEASFPYRSEQALVSYPEFQFHLSSVNRKLEALRKSLKPRKAKTMLDCLDCGPGRKRGPRPPPPPAGFWEIL
ncbi:carbonic anhydrase 6 [Ochotona curzoniae]|uniref:carbonic anhydrase 6 n=1 Tax=Ochotona curzoniae TaxID=130825 RepID=UPI001B34CBBB|nr:carbonic anhydrase 6 [Ochotona curzoniae]